ncbi:MAG: PAS domain-containing sensor histidine kinase [Armatimonadetes bacterium]|nr:PAS domain-containing sensor histidine kinase [Armatimonadota bacterium]
MARRVRGQLLEALLDGLQDACLGVDRSGRIKFINPAACRLLEIRGDVLEEKFWDVFPINDFTRSLSGIVNDYDPSPTEQVVVFPDDRVYLAALIPVFNEGRNQGVVALLRDMAAVQKIEKGIDQFLADINRQLKLPLTAIKGYVETLLEGAYTNEAITRRFLQVINEETNRLTRLAVSLEEAAGAAGPAPAPEPTDLVPLVRASVEMFSSIAAEKNLQLKAELPDRLPPVMVEREGFRKVLINLIDNAVKCTGLKGHGWVRVSGDCREGSVIVAVNDSGVGIPEPEQERIFEQFYRVKTGPAAELGGTGLGLFLAREIVSRLGGTITVESKPEEGATFSVRLPLL